MKMLTTAVLLLVSPVFSGALNFDGQAVTAAGITADSRVVPEVPSPSRAEALPVTRHGLRYKDFLLDPAYAPAYAAALGGKCVKELQDFYRSHDSLRSDYVVSHSRTLGELKHSAGRVPVYHYTDSSVIIREFSPAIKDRAALHAAMTDPASEFTYTDLLIYPRSSPARGEAVWMQSWGNMETTVLFVADNPYTSSAYGHVQAAFWMSPDTRVYDVTSGAGELREAIRREPGKDRLADACGSGLNLIVFEDSGVDLVDYTSGTFEPGKRPGWYYLISTSRITGSDALELSARDARPAEVNRALAAAGRASEIDPAFK